MHPWLEAWGEAIPVDELTGPLALQLTRQVGASSDGIAEIVSTRRKGAVEVVVLDVTTGCPQRPLHDIKRVERVAVLLKPGEAPRVLALRADFPDTPHQLLMLAGFPCGLCIDDRPWADARPSYTATELLERITSWFRRAGRGELQDLGQPLDPLFVGYGFEVIVPRSAWTGQDAELVGYIPRDTARPRHIIARRLEDLPEGAAPPEARLVMLAYDLGPQPLARLRVAPGNLEALHAEMTRRGLDLVADLTRRVSAWHAIGGAAGGRLASRLLLLFRIAVINPADPATSHIETIAFASALTIGEVGERLGILLPNASAGTSGAPFVKNIVPLPPRLDGIALEMALVHAEFDAELAQALSGHRSSGSQATVLIGAGAIASMVCEPLVREGRVGPLTIVDDDTLLPHNLARHTLLTVDVGRSKARALAERLINVRRDLSAEAMDANALLDTDNACSRACEAADVVIDASASVPVARKLSDLGGASRRASVFFNPGGTAAVLLIEDEERKSDLRSLEAAYHRELQVNTSLADHMAVPGTLRYTGACRSLTSRMPASRAQALAGIVAQGVAGAVDSEAAVVRIWTMHEDGRVDVATADTACERHERGGWTVVLPSSLAGWLAKQRADCLPAETGGVVLGIIDLDAKRIDLVEALAAPPDSMGTPVAFVRGIQGLRPAIDAAVSRSLGQIRYLGEWHSHPRGAGALPSITDIEQIVWLADILQPDCVPGVMLIVGDEGVNVIVGELRDGGA